MLILELIATLCVFVGVYLIAKINIKGYYWMSAAQVLWIAFGIINVHYIFAIQGVALLLFNFYGIYNWRKENVG